MQGDTVSLLVKTMKKYHIS